MIYKRPLRFDFAIFDKYKNLIALCEFQGQQHYAPVKFNNISEDKANNVFREQLIKDNIKRDYCNKKSIELIEIRYDEIDKISYFLDKFIRYGLNS